LLSLQETAFVYAEGQLCFFNSKKSFSASVLSSIFIRFIAQTVYKRSKSINYKIVPVTNFNKYLHYGAMEMNNMYINMDVNNGREK